MNKITTWHEFLIQKLTNPDEAMGYLQTALQEYLVDGDTQFFRKGLRNVVEAQGGITDVAKKAEIPPDILTKFLSDEEPLHLDTLISLIKAFGWQLSIESITEVQNKDMASQLTTSEESNINHPVESST
ncbi:transcriptional regulator [Candidatus Poribacteria bacterium]|nr:MAG: transcriptional regulator [Candidatus Poribacteria bacterium]